MAFYHVHILLQALYQEERELPNRTGEHPIALYLKALAKGGSLPVTYLSSYPPLQLT